MAETGGELIWFNYCLSIRLYVSSIIWISNKD